MSVENTTDQQSKRLPGSKPLRESRIERNGIKAGTIAPAFTMTDICGRSISLEEYRGRRVVLVFSDPHCGPCSQLAPYLARAYRRRAPITTEIVMVSRGDIEENRRKAEADGFEFPVVVQDRWKVSRKYGIFATPAAFLIAEDGRTEARDGPVSARPPPLAAPNRDHARPRRRTPADAGWPAEPESGPAVPRRCAVWSRCQSNQRTVVAASHQRRIRHPRRCRMTEAS